MILCVGSFLPFTTRYWINGHSFIAGELQRQGIPFRKDDNAFLGVSHPQALQAAADRLSPEIIRPRLDYWTFVLGPKFSKKDRAAIPLQREYSLNQVEYALHFVFRRNFPIHKIFERSAELGVFCLTADKIAQIFGKGNCSMSMSTFRCFSAWLFPSLRGRAKSRGLRFKTPA